jgi:hypothetical protein
MTTTAKPRGTALGIFVMQIKTRATTSEPKPTIK